MRPLVLASASPRRVDLLRHAGFQFEIVLPQVEEAHDASLTPEQLTLENARRKALDVSRLRPDALVIGADTLVYVDGLPLGKPADMDEALRMVRRLSGRTHEVCTGVAFASGGAIAQELHVITHVTFKPLTNDLIRAYHALVNPLDKAGAYGIQEQTDMLLERMVGSFTNVIGLPVDEVSTALLKLLSRPPGTQAG
ncbi:Maf family protein [Prosthecobacter vanneervenii]|uniref:dTTP/UTP pyrophosphatase n=1 Tax=Prosthecobacter vanneervenii TaxID=48466 RepID=A0A7W7YD98_9BACT|nr:Maf family protein [Prosthecobacter vanneervenii]MBB5034081.1 septum formation protein [Prosthecobacter vanneervenii]